jgi:site-specific DNA-methyltransferase (adenine-specific)
MPADWKDKLFFGDNLAVLRKDIPDDCVDLIYLDPPFNSNASYNVLFKEQKTGKKSAAQITAFEDTWYWTLKESQVAYEEVVRSGHSKLSDLIQAMRKVLGENDMLAYLVMMAVRVMELHRVLKPTGSIYLHCDPKASHYLKLLLDATFGKEQFRNDIIWLRATPRGHAFTRFPSSHDVLLHYSKGTSCTWNSDEVFQHYDLGDLDEKTAGKYTLHDPDGRTYQLTSLLNPNPNRPNRNISGKPFSWCEEIIYIGMTNAPYGLKGRLRHFDATISGKATNHGGADRVRYAHQNYELLSPQLYVAVAAFKCDVLSNKPQDLAKGSALEIPVGFGSQEPEVRSC